MGEIEKKRRPKIELLVYLSFSIIIILGFIMYYFFFRIDESQLEQVEIQIESNNEINEYIPSVSFSRNEDEETVEYKGLKSYSYSLLGNFSDEFLKLSQNEKLEKLSIVEDILGDTTSCGRKKYCSIDTIHLFSNSGSSESYQLDLYSHEFVHTYYDKNDRFQSEVLSVTKADNKTSANTNITTSYTEPLILEEKSCEIDGNYIYARGYVKNQSDQTLSYIEVTSNFTDSTGNIVDTDYTYAVGAEGLAPNGRKSYEIMTPINESMERCVTKIVDYQ